MTAPAIVTTQARHPRGRCAECNRRRVLFSLVATAPGSDGAAETPRLCADCAGIGTEPTPLTDLERADLIINLLRSIERIDAMGLSGDPDILAALRRADADLRVTEPPYAGSLSVKVDDVELAPTAPE